MPPPMCCAPFEGQARANKLRLQHMQGAQTILDVRFENLQYQQQHVYDTNIMKTLKQYKSAGIQEGAVVPRHVLLDATQLSVVHALINSDVDPMLMIGAGGY